MHRQNLKAVSFLATLLLLLSAVSALAQDRFGSAVQADGDQVWVLKPGTTLGPPAILNYRRSDESGWQVTMRLEPAASLATGESLSPSIAVSNGMLLAGSADPDVRWAAHFFRSASESDWEERGRVPLEFTHQDAVAAPEKLDRAAVFRILRPPTRVVALSADIAAVGLTRTSAQSPAGVRVLRRDPATDEWKDDGWAAIDSAGSADGFASAIALIGDRVLVGAPSYDCSGAVFVFRPGSDAGMWEQETVIRQDDQDDTDCAGRFGAVIVADGETLLIGAPGGDDRPGTVTAWQRQEDSPGWTQTRQIAPPEEAIAGEFGRAMAVSDDELWVGAPQANEGSGLVFRYARSGGTDEWMPSDMAAPTSDGAGLAFGSAIGLANNVAVVGAPGAGAGMGAAVVFDRIGPGEWNQGQWLEPIEALEAVTGAEVRCSEGVANRFDCQNVDLLAFLTPQAIGGQPGEGLSDLWGWTDSLTAREYVLAGRRHAVAVVDITQPAAPVHVANLTANSSGARDLKVYRNHLFFTGDGAGDHGLLVFDLTRLRGLSKGPVTLEPDARYAEISSAHNLAIDTESGFAFVVGASGKGRTCGGGLHMVDIRDPLNPSFAGCYTDTEGVLWAGRTHDTQCVVYRGPDAEFQGRQICFASNESALRIVDVTDKDNPEPLAAASHPRLAYAHQGWLTEDQRYFFLDDEIDELTGRAERTRTIIWDVAELEDPIFVGSYLGSSGATDHNLYIKGDRMYQANYQAGLSVIDISDPENPHEIGFFDTTPYGANTPGFSGAWTAFPYFDSGTVAVSSMREGLFILRPRPALVP
ncbi:MAG: choice-of-anchor B family protein [Gemmatimonadota bacterium]